MLRRLRRYLVVLAGIAMAVPILAGMIEPPEVARSDEELRARAPWPVWPRKHRDWRALPRAIDAYLADHFGLRQLMIHWQAEVAHRWLGNGTGAVLVGRHDRLFYLGDAAVAQSAGAIMRDAQVRETIETVSRMRDVLAKRGIAFIAASPPNGATLYEDDLPHWARNPGRPTEPERVLAGLRDRGIAVVDLAKVMSGARAQGNLQLLHDTHWTSLGALVAFNAVAAAAGHVDWRLRPEDVLTPPVPFDTGDLARMLGLGNDLVEQAPSVRLGGGDLKSFGPEAEPFELSTGDRSGPSILVVGDSFTEGTMPAFALAHTGRVGWLNSQRCRFDWARIDAFQPREVWWMPTERYILCDPGARPKGMPEAEEARIPQ